MADTIGTIPCDLGGMLEIGTGTGIISISAAVRCDRGFFIATDINFQAAVLAQQNAYLNNVILNVVATKFAMSFRRNSLPEFVVFNPPYLPEDPEFDRFLKPFEHYALIGGKKGTETLEEYLKTMQPHQFGYFIISSLATNPDEFTDAEVIASLKLMDEILYIIKVNSNEN